MTSTVSAGRIVDQQQISQFRSEGFVKLPAVLDAESLDALRAVCIAAESDLSDGLLGQTTDDPLLAERFAYQRDQRFEAMWSNSLDLRLRYPEVARLVTDLAGVARQLVGDPDVKVFWDKTFVKPPVQVGTRESVWHQDYPYNPIDRRGMLTIWLAVEDVPAESGALRFVPRSHRLGPLGRFDLVSGEHGLTDILRPDDLDLVGEPVTVPLRAGDATVHDALTLHGAGPNLSKRPRRAWTVVFMPGGTRYLGGPHPHRNIDALGMVPYQTFDHPQFTVAPDDRPDLSVQP
jgi:ectoine hydroxylase-related dioxygenase (phytanoyl-CoA dioxygenase family)